MRRPDLARVRLTPRLLAAQLVVVVSGSLSLIVVALVVAPQLFETHLRRAGENDPMVRHHAGQAFDTALGISLLVATTVSVLMALVIAVLVVRRVSGPVSQLAH